MRIFAALFLLLCLSAQAMAQNALDSGASESAPAATVKTTDPTGAPVLRLAATAPNGGVKLAAVGQITDPAVLINKGLIWVQPFKVPNDPGYRDYWGWAVVNISIPADPRLTYRCVYQAWTDSNGQPVSRVKNINVAEVIRELRAVKRPLTGSVYTSAVRWSPDYIALHESDPGKYPFRVEFTITLGTKSVKVTQDFDIPRAFYYATAKAN